MCAFSSLHLVELLRRKLARDGPDEGKRNKKIQHFLLECLLYRLPGGIHLLRTHR